MNKLSQPEIPQEQPAIKAGSENIASQNEVAIDKMKLMAFVQRLKATQKLLESIPLNQQKFRNEQRKNRDFSIAEMHDAIMKASPREMENRPEYFGALLSRLNEKKIEQTLEALLIQENDMKRNAQMELDL